MGRLLVFEGIDGSGKSTAMRHVAQALMDDGVSIVATKEETDTPLGEAVRRSIKDGGDPWATTFLFLADRAEHVRQVQAWQADGKHVLCDRFLHSTLAYQAHTLRGALPDALSFLRSIHEPWCPLPDAVLLFKADPAACVARTQERGATTPYEKEAFLAAVQENYMAMAADDPDRFTVVDANLPAEDVARDALAWARAQC